MMHFRMYLEDSLDLSDVSWITRVLTLTMPMRRPLSSKKARRSKHHINVIMKYKIELVHVEVYSITKVLLIDA